MRMLIAISFIAVAAGGAAASQTGTPPVAGADERCAAASRGKIEALTVKQGTAAPAAGSGAGSGAPTAIINTSRSNIRGNRMAGPQAPDCPRRDQSHDVHELEK